MRQGGLIRTCSRPCAFEAKKTKKKRNPTTQNTPRNKSTAARRPGPPRDGVRRNTSHALAHTRTLPPYIPGLWNRPRLYTHVCTYSHCCRCAACVRFGALFSAQHSFVFLCCDNRMYLRFRGCPVVLDIELSVSARYHKTRRVLLRARRLLLLLLTTESRERRRAVCGITSKLTSNGAETK